tara:strand:- start:438 stop:659 length:222 start_codon:yes stop_codon:yes gene_type:complete
MRDVKIGDLVQCITEPEVGIGIVVETGLSVSWGAPQEPPCIKVQWRTPSFYDPADGASVMYSDEVKVISEGRR